MTKCNEKSCKKKLTLVDRSIICKCDQYFCTVHRPIENHVCVEIFSDVKPIIKCVPKKVIMI